MKVLVALGVIAALLVCGGSAVALYGLSGRRGEVCSYLGDRPEIVSRTGRLTHCDPLEPQGEALVFELAGDLGKGRAIVTSSPDRYGNEHFQHVRFVIGGDEIVVGGQQ